MTEKGSNSNNKGRNNNRNRNKNRNRNNNNRNANAKGQLGRSGNQSRPRRRYRRGSGQSDILRKYDNLLAQHLIARKKYYEYYHRADDRQFEKLEHNFYNSLKQVREFEAGLSEQDREKFNKRYNGRPLDTIYTQNRDMGHEGDQVEFVGEFEDPHYLITQREHEWSDDTEESSGSLDDYKAYKGIVD